MTASSYLMYKATVAVAATAIAAVTAAAAATPTAFVSPKGHGSGGRDLNAPRRQRVGPSLFVSTSNGGADADLISFAPTPLESILDDGHGHINSELARAIYEWETAHRAQWPTTNPDGAVSADSDTKGQGKHGREMFSTRDGLRVVDEIARELLSHLGHSKNSAGSASSSSGASSVVSSTSSSSAGASDDGAAGSYSDLVQEGIVALMRAMATYGDPDHLHDATSGERKEERPSFEGHARSRIRDAMVRTLAYSSRPIRLPRSAQDALVRADAAVIALRASSKTGREPTLFEVARAVNVDPQRLHLYRSVGRGTLSVESTVEVRDPSVVAPFVRTLRDEDDEESVDDERTNDALVATSGSPIEDDWSGENPEREVSPLRDALVDDDDLFNQPDARAYRENMRDDLDDFLTRTLTDEESLVVRLRFGLLDSKKGRRGWKIDEVGRRLGISPEEVSKVASGALQKLRKAKEGGLAYLDDDVDEQHTEVSL